MTSLYRLIETAIRNQYDCLHGISNSPEEIQVALRQVMRNNPDIFWFAHQYQFDETASTIHFQYTFSKERVEIIKFRIEDVITHDLCIEHVKRLTAQEQIAYVYKWLITYCNYNINSAYNQSIYSVFIARNSVCTGYAKAAQYIFNILGIENVLVFGRLHNAPKDSRHCWNVVKLYDRYFHFDTCFDNETIENNNTQPKTQAIFKANAVYKFLCASTDDILSTRDIENPELIPFCSTSWANGMSSLLNKIALKQRADLLGGLLSSIGTTANIYLCTKDKNTVLKVFYPNGRTPCIEEYRHMKQTTGCEHTIQCIDKYTDTANGIIAIEQVTPIMDLLCSPYYKLSLKGLIKMANDIATAWMECKIKGVLYRDIHICNIYRTNNGIFKLGDFGSCTTDFNIRETVGSPWFMAPETIHFGIFNEASAIYSISMVIYFVLNDLRPAFWGQECKEVAITKRISGKSLPLPKNCLCLPYSIVNAINIFFCKVAAVDPIDRVNDITDFIHELKILEINCGGDYVIHHKGNNSNFDFQTITANRTIFKYDQLNAHLGKTMSIAEQTSPQKSCVDGLSVDEIEQFASTATCTPNYAPQVYPCAYPPMTLATYLPNPDVSSHLDQRQLVQANSPTIYSSIFAPAEIRRKSNLIIQVYLHREDETQMVNILARESDRNAERRDYVPLSLNLNKGDKIDVELNIYGEEELMSKRKTLIWQGSFTKCSFSYFVPKDIEVDELNCEAVIFINGVPIGEMRFITHIVDSPRAVNTKITAHQYNKIFISYAHEDVQKIKYISLAYKAQGVNYFFDRDSLEIGDVYEEKIFDYIDSSDLFILCWSKNAQQSSYVAKEKNRAMLRAYPQLDKKEATLKICPVSIEPHAELPDDMKGIYNFEVI